MRVAVYTIAKNEQQFVSRWATSCAEADYRLILDTGSTDNTVDLAQKHGVATSIKTFTPWRFDHARNHALDLLPDDIDLCIALDMDEVLQPGWRQALEGVPKSTTRPRYKYVWSWNPDGSEGLVYGGDKIHSRHNYRWRHPVHEVLQPVDCVESQFWVDGLVIHHYPDSSKSRGQYFDLLKLAVAEKPDDDRNQFYLGREYFYHQMFDDAMRHLKVAVDLSGWPPERAAAFRMMYRMTGDPSYLFDALRADPTRRENLVAMAQYYYESKNWAACKQFCQCALNISVKPLDYLCEPDVWGWLPHDLMAVASYYLGDHVSAYRYGLEAVRLNPSDDRLQNNLGYYCNGFAATC